MLLTSLLFLAASVERAPFIDTARTFSIDFPNGWSAVIVDSTGSFQSTARDGKLYCRANSRAVASLDGLEQADLNREFGQPISLQTWADVYQIDASKMQISESRAVLVDNRITQVVTITFAPDLLGAPMKGRFISYIMPGRMINAGCFAPPEAFDRARALFDRVTSSLKPL